MPVSARSARYSGSERPAWRMNHTGTRGGRPPRAATRNGASRRSRRACGAGGTATVGVVTMVRRFSHVGSGYRVAPGAPVPADTRFDLKSPLVSDPTGLPEEFRRAVAALSTVRPRPELVLSPVDAPPRLAPYTWALGVEADAARRPGEDLDEPDTSGRLILLHDPAGQDAWEGRFRLVCFVQARLEREQLGDEMLPVVAWSWLTEALEHHDAPYTALGGTVTQTSSVRFGDISGPRRDDDVELRASWTPVGSELTRHADAFCEFVAVAAGLPPVGAVPLVHRTV